MNQTDKAYLDYMFAVMVLCEAYRAVASAEQNAFEHVFTREELVKLLKKSGIKIQDTDVKEL